ncbi:MAG: hypothetical protein D3910_15365, partial [Candidatus Electrothrix sp. ATG2]|nr:hypothetical protein [Candidatus Electrothrix sp. ATG2]
MVKKRQHPEEQKDLSKITKVILNDLKGRREIQHDYTRKKTIQPTRKKKRREENRDHTQWMPKQVPKEFKQAIKEVEKQKKKPPVLKQKIS